ncbi:MAG: hypothetical protein ACMG57_00225 [Candidatus Dojkabacteria bacterium]
MSDDGNKETPEVELTPNTIKVLNGWTETEIGEVPIFDLGTNYPTHDDIPEYHGTYLIIQKLKNLWVNIPTTADISTVTLLQKKIEVSTTCVILKILGFKIEGPLDLDVLLKEVEELYSGTHLEALQTGTRLSTDDSFGLSVGGAIQQFFLRSFTKPTKLSIEEAELIKGKKVFIITSLMAKGISYGFFHFIQITNDLISQGIINDQSSGDYINNNFGFTSAKMIKKGDKTYYSAEISEHIVNEIINQVKNEEDLSKFSILISDDVIVGGGSIDAVIRRIRSRLEEEGLNKEVIYHCLRNLLIDIENSFLCPCVEDETSFTWTVKERLGRVSAVFRIAK